MWAYINVGLPRATARKLRLKIRECFRTIETGAASIGNLPDFVSEYKINTMEFEKCLILAKWGEFHFARGLSRLNEYSLRSYHNTRGRYMSDIGRHPEGNDEIIISPIDKPAAQYGSFIHLGYPFGGMITRRG